MAVLPDNDRKSVWEEWQRANSDTIVDITKAELRTVVNETDAWIDANQASYKAAISDPVKSNLTPKQLERLFMAVAKRRFEI